MMKRLIFLAMLVAAPALAQTDGINGYCTLGATNAVTSNLNSSNKLQGIIPKCTVTVYLTGTTTKATIYADAIGTTLTNGFTADVSGQWLFYAATGQGYDVVMNGGTPPLVYTHAVALTDLKVGGGGGGSGPICQVNGTAISPASPCNFSDSPSIAWAFVSGQIRASVANFVAPILLPMPASFSPGCTTPVTTSMPGLQVGMGFSVGFASLASAVAAAGWGPTGGLVWVPEAQLGQVAWSVCNQTTSTISPGALTLNINAGFGFGGANNVTWPTSGQLVVSNGTNSPGGLAPINGQCAVGIGGVWAVGSCSGSAAVTSVTNGDGTLTITPSIGAVIASLNLGHANTWTGQQTFVAPALGTPISGVLTNATGLPLTTGVTGLLPHANIAATAVTPGSYTSANITVAPDGTITAAANGSGGAGTVTGSGLVGYVPLWTGTTTALGNSHLNELTGGFDTFTQGVKIADASGSAGWWQPAVGTDPGGASGTATYTTDAVTGFAEVHEGTGALARICTATNGICASPTSLPLSCQPGLGDGLNAIPAGTYLTTSCRNETGQTWTLTAIRCVADAGSSTCAVTNGGGGTCSGVSPTSLLTGAITGTSTYANGTQSATTTIAAGDCLKVTYVADGTTKQIGIDVAGTY